MPELPDIAVYIEALERFVAGRTLVAIRLSSPFVVRSVSPPMESLVARRVVGVERLGKRIVIEFEDDHFLVIHLMIAGRLRWRAHGAPPRGKNTLAVFEFENGLLVLTEAGTKRRASLTAVCGRGDLAAINRGGLEVLEATRGEFAQRLKQENHTLKRSLTDPRLFSGIGNAYSDEILHHARLSPLQHSARLTDEEIDRLFESSKTVLADWTSRLRRETGDGFPEVVTAFREGMAVHGRFGKPCPECGNPVQRIRYADNETNYCAYCQTEGRILADRSLSRLLKQDWPRSLDEL